QPRAEFRGRARILSIQRVHDAQPHRVEKQIEFAHWPIFSNLVTLSISISMVRGYRARWTMTHLNETRPASDLPGRGRLYNVGGLRLFADQLGGGSPTVIFLSGGGTVGLDYLNVHERVARFTTSIVYDRAGTGWSQRVPLPRTAARITDELRALLAA